MSGGRFVSARAVRASRAAGIRQQAASQPSARSSPKEWNLSIWRLVGVVDSDRDGLTCVSILRAAATCEPVDRGVSLLTALLPHLRNGLRIHRDMSHLRALQDAAAGALDRLACGCVLLDGEGGLLMANRSARAIFASADGLRLEGNGLQAVNAADNHRLRQLLSGRGGAGQPADCESEMLTISRASGRRPYVAILSRLPRRLTPLCRRQSSVLFLTDPEAAPDGQAAVICEMFGLSAAEVRVASLLMQGADTRQIAQRLRVSYNTARTHIQRILEKPGGRRQADFVRLVLSAMGCVRLR